MPIPKILETANVEAIVAQTPLADTMYFSKNFPSGNSPDDLIQWDIYHGDPGLAPIIHRGAQSPVFQGGGISTMYAKPALISEKIKFTEEDVNKALSSDKYVQEAQSLLLLERVEDLKYRNDMRREWLAASIAFKKGVVTYKDKYGTSFKIDYQIPSDHYEQLSGGYVWGTGASRDVFGDIRKKMQLVKNKTGTKVTAVFMNSNTMFSRLVADGDIADLLARNAHNQTDKSLYANPEAALMWLLQIPLVIYDETYPMSLRITSRTDASNYVLEDVLDLSVGADVTFTKTGFDDQEVVEVGKITSITESTNTITLADALSETFSPNDTVVANVPFLQDDRVVFMTSTVRNRPIFKWMNTPIGLGTKKYGLQVVSQEQFEPDVVWTRAQRQGLWVFGHNQAIATLDVA